MFSQGLSYFSDISMTVLGMFIFLLAFSGISCWTIFRSTSKEYYNKIAEIPLREEE